VADRQEV